MSPPFCWTSVEIGWYTTEYYLVIILAVPFLMLLKRADLGEATMAGIGTMFNAFGTAIYVVANGNAWIFYMGTYVWIIRSF